MPCFLLAIEENQGSMPASQASPIVLVLNCCYVYDVALLVVVVVSSGMYRVGVLSVGVVSRDMVNNAWNPTIVYLVYIYSEVIAAQGMCQ